MDGEEVSFGTWLRRQRELREISLREIADVTKISMRYLEALEQDHFDVLPAPVFAKGFLREYARYVGLDPDEVVNSYLNAQRQEPEPAEEPPPRPPQRAAAGGPWTSGLLLAVLVAALLALATLLVLYAERRQPAAPAEPPPIAAPPVEPEPAPPPPPPTTPEPVAPLLVTMDFTEDCWVEAMVDGSRRLSELHVQGESLQIEAAERVVLTIGNPGGVRLEVNGRPYELSTPPGRVARDVEIDLDTVRQLAGDGP